ncbi:hypothetical protein Tco_0793298 [Tanacetum coccineum]
MKIKRCAGGLFGVMIKGSGVGVGVMLDVALSGSKQNFVLPKLTPQLYESAGGLPRLKLPLHSCSLAGSTSAWKFQVQLHSCLPGREHDVHESFQTGEGHLHFREVGGQSICSPTSKSAGGSQKTKLVSIHAPWQRETECYGSFNSIAFVTTSMDSVKLGNEEKEFNAQFSSFKAYEKKRKESKRKVR